MPSTAAAAPHADAPQPRLPADVGLICHAIRLGALVWIGWSLWKIVAFWGDRAEVVRAYSNLLKLDLSQLPDRHYEAAFALVLADWIIAALIVWFAWRLFGHYLRGDIFAEKSVSEMRCLGWVGVASVAADIFVRVLIRFVLVMHIPDAAPAHRLMAEPNDILHLMMALFVVALARIFKAGVEIAEDHRQIV